MRRRVREQPRPQNVRRVVLGVLGADGRRGNVRRFQVRRAMLGRPEAVRGHMHPHAELMHEPVRVHDARLQWCLRVQQRFELVRLFLLGVQRFFERLGHVRRHELRDSVQLHVQGVRKPVHSFHGLLHERRMPDERDVLG